MGVKSSGQNGLNPAAPEFTFKLTPSVSAIVRISSAPDGRDKPLSGVLTGRAGSGGQNELNLAAPGFIFNPTPTAPKTERISGSPDVQEKLPPGADTEPEPTVQPETVDKVLGGSFSVKFGPGVEIIAMDPITVSSSTIFIFFILFFIYYFLFF